MWFEIVFDFWRINLLGSSVSGKTYLLCMSTRLKVDIGTSGFLNSLMDNEHPSEQRYCE